MDIILVPLLLMTKTVIFIVNIIILASVLLSWLSIANIFNPSNRIVYSVINGITSISDSLLAPVRKRIPVFADSFDLSPLILIILLVFVEQVINRILLRFA